MNLLAQETHFLIFTEWEPIFSISFLWASGSYMNTQISAKFRTVLLISHERFLPVLFCLCFFRWSEVDMAQLGTGLSNRSHIMQTALFPCVFNINVFPQCVSRPQHSQKRAPSILLLFSFFSGGWQPALRCITATYYISVDQSCLSPQQQHKKKRCIQTILPTAH